MITKIRSLSRFVTQKPNASLLLFLTTIAAVVLANSPLVDAYNSCLEYPLDFRFDNFIFFPHHGQPMSLTTFVNDAFMAIFFFVVGMEIKQELLVGELSSARKALLPVIAACGGMIVPVLVYMSVCHSGPAAHGAAIPMATDIAFALAALLFVWRYLAADLRHSEIRPIWRQILIGSGIAIIVASLLYYLGIFG